MSQLFSKYYCNEKIADKITFTKVHLVAVPEDLIVLHSLPQQFQCFILFPKSMIHCQKD